VIFLEEITKFVFPANVQREKAQSDGSKTGEYGNNDRI